MSKNDTIIAAVDLKTYTNTWTLTVPNTRGGLLVVAPSNTLYLVSRDIIALA